MCKSFIEPKSHNKSVCSVSSSAWCRIRFYFQPTNIDLKIRTLTAGPKRSTYTWWSYVSINIFSFVLRSYLCGSSPFAPTIDLVCNLCDNRDFPIILDPLCFWAQASAIFRWHWIRMLFHVRHFHLHFHSLSCRSWWPDKRQNKRFYFDDLILYSQKDSIQTPSEFCDARVN